MMNLGITAADLTEKGRAELARTEMLPVPADHQSGEPGFTTGTRETALRLLQVLGCTEWTAATISPMYPVTYVDQRWHEIYVLDGGRLRVTVESFRPVGRMTRWSIEVNGQRIAHRAVTRGLPHGSEAVAESVWRHLNQVRHAECDALTCTEQPTTAVFGGGYCAAHLHLYHD